MPNFGRLCSVPGTSSQSVLQAVSLTALINQSWLVAYITASLIPAAGLLALAQKARGKRLRMTS